MITSQIRDVVISDTHFGIPSSDVEALCATLKRLQFERLILNGDIFDSDNLTAYERRFREAIAFINDVRKQGVELVLIGGNHDRDGLRNRPEIFGVPMQNSFEWTRGGKRYLAVHGDQFDPAIKTNKWIQRGVNCVMAMMRRTFKKEVVGAVRKIGGRSRLRARLVREGAVAFAGARDIDTVICGHTHWVEHQIRETETMIGEKVFVEYLNCGSWVENSPKEGYHHAFVWVSDDGAGVQTVSALK